MGDPAGAQGTCQEEVASGLRDSRALNRRHGVVHSPGRSPSTGGFPKCCVTHILWAGPGEKLSWLLAWLGRRGRSRPSLEAPGHSSFLPTTASFRPKGPLGSQDCALSLGKVSHGRGLCASPRSPWACVLDQLLRGHHLCIGWRGGHSLPVHNGGGRRGQHTNDRHLGEYCGAAGAAAPPAGRLWHLRLRLPGADTGVALPGPRRCSEIPAWLLPVAGRWAHLPTGVLASDSQKSQAADLPASPPRARWLSCHT